MRYKKQLLANKSHVCEMCGAEIHPNEYVWWYKPLPILVRGHWKADKWKTRCVDHCPKHYGEYAPFEEGNNQLL